MMMICQQCRLVISPSNDVPVVLSLLLVASSIVYLLNNDWNNPVDFVLDCGATELTDVREVGR